MAQQKVVSTFSADYTLETEYAKRADGQWFKRDNVKHPRFGYGWTAWSKALTPPYKYVEHAGVVVGCYSGDELLERSGKFRSIRLPKE